MIPGGWVGAATLFVVVGAVAIAAIMTYHDLRADAREKRHEREMAKLEHRQNLDETAMESEFGRDADGDAKGSEDASKSVALEPQVQLGSTETRVDCIACGKHIPISEAVEHQRRGGAKVPSCDNDNCRHKAREMLAGEVP